jgi:hypothetical protein
LLCALESADRLVFIGADGEPHVVEIVTLCDDSSDRAPVVVERPTDHLLDNDLLPANPLHRPEPRRG